MKYLCANLEVNPGECLIYNPVKCPVCQEQVPTIICADFVTSYQALHIEAHWHDDVFCNGSGLQVGTVEVKLHYKNQID